MYPPFFVIALIYLFADQPDAFVALAKLALVLSLITFCMACGIDNILQGVYSLLYALCFPVIATLAGFIILAILGGLAYLITKWLNSIDNSILNKWDNLIKRYIKQSDNFKLITMVTGFMLMITLPYIFF